MIIHSQIFDLKTKRTIADYTSTSTASSLGSDELSSECEDIFSKLTEFDMSNQSNQLRVSNDNSVYYFGQ